MLSASLKRSSGSLNAAHLARSPDGRTFRALHVRRGGRALTAGRAWLAQSRGGRAPSTAAVMLAVGTPSPLPRKRAPSLSPRRVRSLAMRSAPASASSPSHASAAGGDGGP